MVLVVFSVFLHNSQSVMRAEVTVKGGLLNIGTLTLPVVHIYWCAVVPVPQCFTYKDTNYATIHLTFLHLTFHCPKSLGRTYRGYKELSDEKDIRL